VLILMKWDRALYGECGFMTAADAHRSLLRIDAASQRPAAAVPLRYGWRIAGFAIISLSTRNLSDPGKSVALWGDVDKKLNQSILLTRICPRCAGPCGSATPLSGLIYPELTPYPDSIADSAPEKSVNIMAFLDKSR